MLKKQFPLEKNVLAANKIEGSAKELILGHLSKLPAKKLKALANQVKPFLFREDDIELILKAPIFAEKFLQEHIDI
jgi:hypothetical protein